MPSGITHMILSKFCLNRIIKEKNGQAVAILQSNMGPYLVGSVAPDLPYMGFARKIIGNDDEIANDLHYQKTELIPIEGLSRASELADSPIDLDHARALFAFYVGYCSHLVADGLVHPYVRDKVGDYKVAQKKHRILEMKLDLLVADRFHGVGVNQMDFQHELKWMEDCAFRNEVYENYAENIKRAYGHQVEAKHVRGWKEAMELVFELAEGDFPKWWRNLIGDQGAAFKNLEDIMPEMPGLVTLDLPTDAEEKGLTSNFMKKPTVRFFEDVVEGYMERFPKIILKAFEAVFEKKGTLLGLVPRLDLDTGRLIAKNQLSEKPILWELA